MRTKRLFSLIALINAVMFFGSTSAIAQPPYYPSGPQTNVDISTIIGSGWTLCYSENMQIGMIKETISDACSNGDYVMYSGRLVGSSTLLLLAAAERDIVFTVTPFNNAVLGNGSYWYFNDLSIGFSPNSEIRQNTADVCNSVSIPLGCDVSGDGAQRFSLHSSSLALGGWRVGLADFLQNVDTHEKLIFTATRRPTMPLIQTTPISVKLDKDLLTCSSGSYKVGTSEVSINSVRYHLYVNDELMSTVVYDKDLNIQSSLKRNLPDRVAALVSAKDALFDLSGMSSYSAYCVVEAYGYESSYSTHSSVVHDSAYYAAIEAKKAAEESARQAALVEFNSKENRELRKRLAARGIRG